MLRTLTPLLLLALASSAQAARFNLFEQQIVDGLVITDIRIKDVLDVGPPPRLKIYPDEVREHRKLVDILSAGLRFDSEARSMTAEVLADYPPDCWADLSVSVAVAPMSGIERYMPGVTDNRRISGMYIGNCIQEDLPECEYDYRYVSDMDFNLRSFLGVWICAVP